jgi:hypothetical protein
MMGWWKGRGRISKLCESPGRKLNPREVYQTFFRIGKRKNFGRVFAGKCGKAL